MMNIKGKEPINLEPNATPYFIIEYTKDGIERTSLVKRDNLKQWLIENKFNNYA